MAKYLVVISFLVTVIMSVKAFVDRETSMIRHRIQETEEPRLMLERFTYNRYVGSEVAMQLSGTTGHFIEPNKLEIFSDVDGFRRVGQEFQDISCQLLTVHFSGNGLTDVLARSEVHRAEFDSQVEMRLSEQTLKTDYAEYIPRREVLRSAQPVKILGQNREIHSDSGFVYDIANGQLRLHGHVTGTLQLNKE